MNFQASFGLIFDLYSYDKSRPLKWYGKYVTVGENANSVSEQEIPLQYQSPDLLTVSGSNRSNTSKK